MSPETITYTYTGSVEPNNVNNTITWINNQRYGEEGEKKIFDEGNVTLHNGEKIKAVLMSNADDLLYYVEKNKQIKDIFIDEAQFFDVDYVNGDAENSMYNACSKLFNFIIS